MYLDPIPGIVDGCRPPPTHHAADEILVAFLVQPRGAQAADVSSAAAE
ncbi:hypothetical protein [Nocardia sp. NBC_01009]|nr:hypothetical protein OHA42_09440 [Nocardia sp. NBC_01009]